MFIHLKDINFTIIYRFYYHYLFFETNFLIKFIKNF